MTSEFVKLDLGKFVFIGTRKKEPDGPTDPETVRVDPTGPLGGRVSTLCVWASSGPQNRLLGVSEQNCRTTLSLSDFPWSGGSF